MHLYNLMNVITVWKLIHLLSCENGTIISHCPARLQFMTIDTPKKRLLRSLCDLILSFKTILLQSERKIVQNYGVFVKHCD
jgi:hypothetical protein